MSGFQMGKWMARWWESAMAEWREAKSEWWSVVSKECLWLELA